jgi:hypothetical protein
MLLRPLQHVRSNVIAYLALFLAIGGGGYAVAATNTKTITVCADKKSGVLHLKTRGRCKRTQTRVTWNQQGPRGAQGIPGPTGQRGAQGIQGPRGAQGAPAVSVWANVSDPGVVIAGQGISVQHVSAGTYQVTITDPTCSRETNAPVVSVSDANPPAGHSVGAFPVAWYGATGANQQFTVFTGVVAGGTFTASDHTFDVHDTCP